MGVMNGHGVATVKTVEYKVSKNGKEYAVIDSWFSAQNNNAESNKPKEATDFFAVKIYCFGFHDVVGALVKGDNIMVDGPMRYRLWTSPEGKTLVFFDLTARSLNHFIAKPYEPRTTPIISSQLSESKLDDVPF